MTRIVRPLLVVAMLAGAVVAASPADGAPVRISTTTLPERTRFGDVIHARVTVRAAFAARVQGGFAPYDVVRSRSTSSRSGRVVTTVATFDLQCLDPQCVPGAGARAIALAPSRVVVGPRALTARFARVVVEPRATAGQVAHPGRSFLHSTVPPPVSYRVSPARLRRLLLAGAALLVLLAAGVLWPLRRGRARSHAPEPDALEHALALVRAARSRPPPDRRRALGLLSRTLRRRGEADVARAAADLAWSQPDPDVDRMETLADRVEAAP